MNTILKNSLISVGAAVVGIAGFYLYTKAATTDSITVSITVPQTLSIADDNVNFSIASLTPSVEDTSQLNTLTVASNSSTGFSVTVDLADLAPTPGQLCADSNPANGVCDASGNVFEGDTAASYISVTSDAGTGTLGSHATATFQPTETNLGATSVEVFNVDDQTNADTFNVHYNAFADYTIAADTYKGTITFTIAPKP